MVLSEFSITAQDASVTASASLVCLHAATSFLLSSINTKFGKSVQLVNL